MHCGEKAVEGQVGGDFFPDRSVIRMSCSLLLLFVFLAVMLLLDQLLF